MTCKFLNIIITFFLQAGSYEFKHAHDLGDYELVEAGGGGDQTGVNGNGGNGTTTDSSSNGCDSNGTGTLSSSNGGGGGWQNTLTKRLGAMAFFTMPLMLDSTATAQSLTVTLVRRGWLLRGGGGGSGAEVTTPLVQLGFKSAKQRDAWADLLRDAMYVYGKTGGGGLQNFQLYFYFIIYFYLFL
jgi:hypothetical protein